MFSPFWNLDVFLNIGFLYNIKMLLRKCSLNLTTLVILFYIVNFLQVSAAPSDIAGSHHMKKRHILQMCELISWHANRGCLEYNNYGCFCGLGNTASDSVDSIDECCRIHDQCYGRVQCFWFYPQMVGYSVNCTTTTQCSCTDSPFLARCAYTTCMCDLHLAQCLARYEYNSTFKNHDRTKCI